MLGFHYLKAPPTMHVQHYRGGQLVREGVGQSYFYFAPTSMIVLVPVSSRDVPFVFNEVTADFQDVTIQGELTCRIRDPKKTAALLDHSVSSLSSFPWRMRSSAFCAAAAISLMSARRGSLGSISSSRSSANPRMIPI